MLLTLHFRDVIYHPTTQFMFIYGLHAALMHIPSQF